MGGGGEAVVTEIITEVYPQGWPLYAGGLREQILREDREILAILMEYAKGILNE
jgi:hypothetical protein